MRQNQLLVGIGECFTQMHDHLSEIIQYSGRYIFRMGRYYECLESKSLDYYFVQLGAKGYQNPQFYYGACLPKPCNNNTIKAILEYALDSAKVPLQVVAVSHKINQFEYPQNWAFYFTLLMIAVLGTLVLISTCTSKSKQSKLLRPFSVQENVKIFSYTQGSRLNILNGIRSLSMLWVICGHAITMIIGYSQNILTVQKNALSDWRFLAIQAGLYSVDVFFFVGGFLLAYSFLKQKTNSLYKYPLAILNRFLRFLPSYFFAIMFYYGLSLHIGKGPFWHRAFQQVETCKDFWRPLLYVDNLINNGQTMCMPWGWYMQNDMQLFIYCIFILAIYNKNKSLSFFAIFMSIIANFAYVMTQTFENKQKWLTHISDADQSNARYQQNIYIKPWSRCPPYLYGLLLGMLYHQFLQYQKKMKNSQSKLQEIKTACQQEIIIDDQQVDQPFLFACKKFFLQHPWYRRLIQTIGLSICLFISFIPRTDQGDRHWPQFVNSFYLTYGKIGFVFGLSLVIIPSLILPSNLNSHNQSKINHQDHSPLVRFALDTKLFNFIAKVSFCTYLIHLTLITCFMMSISTDFYYTFSPAFVIFVAFSVISLFAGTLMVFLVQAPFTKLQKQLMKKLNKSNKQKQIIMNDKNEQKSMQAVNAHKIENQEIKNQSD